MSSLSVFIMECAVLIAIPTMAWRYFGLRHITPLAMVQIAVGLALGPSLLGRLAPDVQHFLFPDESVAKRGDACRRDLCIYQRHAS